MKPHRKMSRHAHRHSYNLAKMNGDSSQAAVADRISVFYGLKILVIAEISPPSRPTAIKGHKVSSQKKLTQ